MKLFLVLISTLSFQLLADTRPSQGLSDLLKSEKLKLSRADHIIAENMVNMLKLTEKGYINKEVLARVLKDTEKSLHFGIFNPWLKKIDHVSQLNSTIDFISYCREYSVKKETLPLEKVLEKVVGNYCRERTLEAIARDIDKSKKLSDEATLFIQENLKFFLTKKNKKNFAYFIQTQSSRPEILKKLSQEVTTYSVMNEIVPSQEVLKDILINEQITKLIQDKGFNPLQNQNVFYVEYGKLISLGYKSLEGTPNPDKVKEHFNFLKNYLELNQDHLPKGLCLTRLNDFGKAVFRNKFIDLSRDIFKYIVKKNQKEVHEDALFFYMWTHIDSKDFKGAFKLANQHGIVKNVKQLSDARLKYWVADLQENLDDKESAIPIYEDIVLNHPLNYYSIMATKKLQRLKKESPAVTFYHNSVKTTDSTGISLEEFDQGHISSLVRLKAWAKIDSNRMMNLEIKRIKNHSMPDYLVKKPVEKQLYLKSDLHLLTARMIQDSDNHLATFRYIYQVLDNKEVIFNRQVLEILYPKPYLSILNKELKKNPIDPIVALSLIRQESVFNPLARSSVGARGLMQLMPTTARHIRRSVRDKHLVNPEINIELGIKYLTNLNKRYDGNLVYILSAYNAGESRVTRWRASYFDEEASIVKNIEQIPFLETRNYVKLIFRNIFFYKLLENSNELADPSEFNKLFDVKLGFKH